MARHIVLGNQSLLINIDKWMQIRDIYYPFVGQYNHLIGHAHRICILEGDSMSWLNGDEWEKKLEYEEDVLITNNIAINKKKKLELKFNESVYCKESIFFRKIKIKNKSNKKRKIRICFLQDFHLYGDGIGDCGFYNPKTDSIIHYKRAIYFLMGICGFKGKNLLSDFDIGEEIGAGWNLKKRPIFQGNVDSVMCTDVEIQANGEKEICFYLVAGENLDEVYNLQTHFLKKGVDMHLKYIKECQKGFLKRIKPDIKILPKKIQNLYKRSILVLKTQIDRRGAILAANDSDNLEFNRDTYSYMWPRDGAFVAISLIKAGYFEDAKNFFEFCQDVLYKEGCLLHKYNPDKTLGSSWHPWVLNGEITLPIQEDETALVLHALWIYYEVTDDKEFIKKLYPKLIKPMAEFLSKYRYKNGLPKESYDIWEERRGIFTFTTSATLAGLLAGHRLGSVFSDKKLCEKCNFGFEIIKEAMIKYLYNEEKGYFRRSVSFDGQDIVYDDAMDSSCYGLFEFDVFDVQDEKLVSTMEKWKEWLWVKTEVGGMSRYLDDYYHKRSRNLDQVPGNPWFVCTLWYAKWIIKKAKKKSELKEALDIINWVSKHALSTGILAEQLNPYTGEALSVSPLTWSHAEFIDTVTNYVEKIRSLASGSL